MRVYLSGPIEYAEDHGVNWRNKVKEALALVGDVELVDPCDSSLQLLAEHGIESVDDYHGLKYGSQDDQELFRAATRTLISHDVNEVRRSDLLFTKISHVASGGTSGEITLARFLDIPVIAFCEDNIQEVSGWVQSVPNMLFTGEDCLERTIDTLHNPEFRNVIANWHRSQETEG